MKKKFERFLIMLARNDFFWMILKPLSTAGIVLRAARLDYENSKKKNRKEFDDFVRDIKSNLIVRNGLFKGMKYANPKSFGSAFYPKLIGSYERELHSELQQMLSKNQYSEIIDVGCAEGYYAVGLARICENSKVFAYDTSDMARQLCAEMVVVNDVEDKVEIRSAMTPNELNEFSFSGKGLIICDCEGYEKQLFNPENIYNLKSCDLIIELHDFIDISISRYLKDLFSRTHHVRTIYSTDDIHKVFNYNYPEIDHLTDIEKKTVIGERRPATMEWLICTTPL